MGIQTIADIAIRKTTYMEKKDSKSLNKKLNFFEIGFNASEINVIYRVCLDTVDLAENESIRWYALHDMLATSQHIIAEAANNEAASSYKIPTHLFDLEEYIKVFGKYNSEKLSKEDRFLLLRIKCAFEISQNMYRDIIKKYVAFSQEDKLHLYLTDWDQFDN